MASQGWTPGDHLGVQGSAHSEFHTDANFSHIRVTIKDDNLGLGAKIGSGVGPGQCTGLDAFQNLLGRLNGKDEDEIEKEQKSKDDLRRAVYTEQRWGSIRFVKGGLLIGDKIQDLIADEKERVRKLKAVGSSSESDSSEEESDEETPSAQEKKSRKRKLEDVEDVAPEIVAVKVKKSKKTKDKDSEGKTKKSKKSRIESSSASDAEVTETLSKVKLSKRERKAKKDALADAEADAESSEDEEARRVRKQEKKKRKEEKRLRKEQAKADPSKESKSKSKKDKKKEKDKSKESSRMTTVENTPVGSGTSTPVMGGRHAVRARNIAQKRLAAMDVAGLNQVILLPSISWIVC